MLTNFSVPASNVVLVLIKLALMDSSKTVTMDVSTFNVRGLTNKFKQNCLLEDNASFKLDFCLLQVMNAPNFTP